MVLGPLILVTTCLGIEMAFACTIECATVAFMVPFPSFPFYGIISVLVSK